MQLQLPRRRSRKNTQPSVKESPLPTNEAPKINYDEECRQSAPQLRTRKKTRMIAPMWLLTMIEMLVPIMTNKDG